MKCNKGLYITIIWTFGSLFWLVMTKRTVSCSYQKSVLVVLYECRDNTVRWGAALLQCSALLKQQCTTAHQCTTNTTGQRLYCNKNSSTNGTTAPNWIDFTNSSVLITTRKPNNHIGYSKEQYLWLGYMDIFSFIFNSSTVLYTFCCDTHQPFLERED